MTDPGTLIGGRYRLAEQIGAGAMGVVWRGRDERLGRAVALKQLSLSPSFAAGLGRDGAVQTNERMMREGRIAAKLHHPNAISVFDVTDHDGAPWLIMEYLPSRSLAAVLAERGSLPPHEVARIGRQLADALAAAHAAGIVHRDVKPGNVLLGDRGVVKLTDFGISRAADDVTLTRTGMLAGTPAYLAPEVARGADPSPASDVFSLGATLYAAVEGRPPFGSADNTLAILHQVSGGQVPPPRRAGPLTALLMQLLRADPAQRPSMVQASAILSALAEGRALPAPAVFDGGVDAIGSPEFGGPGPHRGGSGGTGGVLPVAPVQQTRMDLPPAAEPAGNEPDRRPALLIAAGVALAVLAGLLVLAAVTRPSRPSAQGPASATRITVEATTAPSTTTTPPPTTTSAPASSAELQQVVSTYYALLPDDPDKAWAMLSPSLQAQGFDKYEDFWRDVDSVHATPSQADPATMTVRVIVVYRKDGRKPAAEVHDLVLIRSGGALLIGRDSKVGSVLPTTRRRG